MHTHVCVCVSACANVRWGRGGGMLAWFICKCGQRDLPQLMNNLIITMSILFFRDIFSPTSLTDNVEKKLRWYDVTIISILIIILYDFDGNSL